MKNFLLFLVPAMLYNITFAQQQTIITDYQKAIKLNSKVKPADVYSAAENWFSSYGALFTAKNAEAPEPSKLKNKQAVEDAYDNHHPLQTLDPAAYRVLGQGIVKYFGGTKTSIRMLYIKYDISIQASAGQAMFKVNNVRYFHFDPKNYTEAGIFSFKGGQPCDYTGTMEYLKGCQVSETEFTALALFFNKTVTNLQSAFTKELGNKKMLATTSATASAKKPVKKSAASTSSKASVKK